MKTSNITYQDIPKSTITNKDNKRIYYRRKTLANGKVGKYTYMHKEDKDYILFWCNRLVCDVAAKQVIDPYLFEDLYKSRNSMPKSGYSSKRNSIMTYCAGIVSNCMRNPDEDIAYNQLGYIKKLFVLLNYMYSEGILADELGYNHNTREKNIAPKNVVFLEA